MGEPPLSPPAPNNRRIRFLWHRSFHPAISVRIERAAGAASLIATETSDPIGGAVTRQVEIRLSVEQMDSIDSAVASLGYWSLPVTESPEGMDGATWILEVSDADRYHFVTRWNGGELESIGRELLALSELDPSPIY